MNSKSKLLWLASGLAVVASGGAVAAGKSMAQRDAKTQKVFEASRLQQQPRTMTDAAASKMKLANGTEGYLVPTELWNTLAVEKDAQGKLRVIETDGTTAPASSTEAATHE